MSLRSKIKYLFWPKDRTERVRRAELIFWAFIFALSQSPLPFGFLAWFALVRPLAIISRLEGKQAFGSAYFYSWFANLFTLYWVAVVTPPGMVAAVFIMSLYPALVLSAFSAIYQRKKLWGLLLLPFLWVGMEYFRSLTEISFPWTDLAYSQGYYLRLIQIVSVIGCYGLSFLIVLLNIFVWQAISRRNRLERRVSSALAFIGVLLFVYLYGYVVFPVYPESGPFKVALLQGNVDLKTKWKVETRERNFILYDSLVQIAVADSVDLIIWPETAAPTYLGQPSWYSSMAKMTAKRSGTTNLIGSLDIVRDGENERSYNSAFQLSPKGQIDQVYHKIKLVPFSERSPYQKYLPFLTRDFLSKYLEAIRTHQVQWWSNFYAGDSIILFDVNGVKYSTLICYEAAFPEYVREGVLKGASFIVNITNDTWFGRTIGPYQHMRITVMRAVENRIWLARCANSGISAVIDPYGREMVSAGLYERNILVHGLQLREDLSIFTRYGSFVGKFSFWILLIVLFIRLAIKIYNYFNRGTAKSFRVINRLRKRH